LHKTNFKINHENNTQKEFHTKTSTHIDYFNKTRISHSAMTMAETLSEMIGT